MFEHKFGGLLGTNIIIDENTVFIGRKEVKFDDLVTVYIAEPTIFSGGYVYFSTTGELPESEMAINIDGFKYSKKQGEEVSKLLDVLKDLEEEKDFSVELAELGLGNLRLDDAVQSQKDKRQRATKSREARTERREERQRLKCPKCKSTNLQHAGNKKKSFSVGKAVGGAVLTGGIGTLAGFAGKKGKKENFVCMNCGKKFAK